MESAPFRVYALTATLIALELCLLAFMTGAVRAKKKKFVLPEDAVLNRGDVADRDDPLVHRAQRAHMNLLESAVPFFIVGALYVLTGATTLGAQAYCYTFLGARVLHPIFYMTGKQPFRTLVFGIGTLSILGMGFHVVRALV